MEAFTRALYIIGYSILYPFMQAGEAVPDQAFLYLCGLLACCVAFYLGRISARGRK